MSKQLKVLVIEDSPEFREFIVEYLLKPNDFAVEVAEDGFSGLSKALKTAPDLILTDYELPKMSGVEVIHHVKSDPETKHIRCVAVTAFMWDHIAQSAGQVGCDGFIAKPFNSVRLLQEVAKYVALPAKPSSGPGALTRA